jgi:hypothetical protein
MNMGTTGSVLVYIIFLLVGFGLQFLVRWSPWVNLAISYLVVAILPPGWSLGLIIGTWISCAFFTFNPEQDRQFAIIPSVSLRKTVFSALWTFAGFLLTLIFLWKIKTSNSLDVFPREILAWVFLILIEVCLYRVIARLSPRLYRIPLGYGIAILNFLMILYWIFPFGLLMIGLILFSLLIINPLLLVLVDMPLNAAQDPIFRRR